MRSSPSSEKELDKQLSKIEPLMRRLMREYGIPETTARPMAAHMLGYEYDDVKEP